MKMKYFLEALPLMAALLLTASCSDKTDEISKTEPAPKGIPYTVTVNTDASTRATIGESGGVKKYLFETNDALHVQNSDGTVYGILLISDASAGKNTGATFSGTIYGSPTDETVLNATLVSMNHQVVTFDVDGKVTGYNYLATAIGSNIEEATQKFSVFTGSSTYGSKSFSLSQQSAFLCFDITLTDGTATGASLVAKVNNDGSEVRSATIETVTEGGKVKAKFVAAFPTSATYGGTTTLSGATVQLGSKTPISFGGSTALARNNYYQVAKEYTSLVQHWPFDGDATNAVSGGVDAIVSGATLTTDRNGTANSAYYFDGIDDKMTASGAAEFGTSSFTANLWVCSTQSSGYGNLLRTDDGYSTNGWLVRFNSGKLEIWEGRSVNRSYVSTNTYSDGLWHMVTYVRDVENHVGQLYVYGSYVGGYADTDNNVTGPLKFGTYGSGEYYKGKMDDVSLYNRALSASEVAELYPAASSRTLSAVTSSEVGWRIGSDGKAYSPVGTLPTGVTAVAMIAYVGAAGSADASSATYKGLAIALADESNSYCHYFGAQETAGVSSSSIMADHKAFLSGITDTQTLITKYGADCAASKAANYSVAGFNPTTFGYSNWFLPSSGQWLKSFEAAGVNVASWSSWDWAPGTGSENWNKINTLLTAVGSSIKEYFWYWSSSEYNNNEAACVHFSSSYGVLTNGRNKATLSDGAGVRAFFAF